MGSTVWCSFLYVHAIDYTFHTHIVYYYDYDKGNSPLIGVILDVGLKRIYC